jgi:hypothetical protein
MHSKTKHPIPTYLLSIEIARQIHKTNFRIDTYLRFVTRNPKIPKRLLQIIGMKIILGAGTVRFFEDISVRVGLDACWICLDNL